MLEDADNVQIVQFFLFKKNIEEIKKIKIEERKKLNLNCRREGVGAGGCRHFLHCRQILPA